MAERMMHGKGFLISVMSLQRLTGFREVNAMILTLQMRNKLLLLHMLSLIMQP